MRSSRLASCVPYAYAAVSHGVPRLVFTAGACPLDDAPSTLLGVAILGYQNQLVEVEAIAALP